MAVRVETPPTIDGILDEPVWQTAPAGGPLIQNSPYPGEPMLQPSEFRVAYDDNFIYVALWHWDAEPDKIVSRLMRRDDTLRPDDYSIVVLDTFNDERNGYWFRINPNGTRQDGITSNNRYRSDLVSVSLSSLSRFTSRSAAMFPGVPFPI